MPRKRDRGVPPLQNEDITGLTPPRQDEVIRKSGTAPDRGDAAHELLEEQQDQARETEPSSDRRGARRAPAGSGQRAGHPGVVDRPKDTELAKHWKPGKKRE